MTGKTEILDNTEKTTESGKKSGSKRGRRKRGKGAEKRHGIDRASKFVAFKRERTHRNTNNH